MERSEPYTDYEIECQIWKEFLYYELKEKQMTKTAKIEACDFLKTFESRNGTMYSYKLTMSNGDVGTINSKSENPSFLGVGQELMYAIQTDAKYGDKFTRLQPDKDKPSVGAFRAGQNWEENISVQKMIVKQNTLQRAFDFYNNGWHGTGMKPSPQELMSLADEFTAWVMK